MRVQKAENVNKALEFITSRGVKLTNIGPEGMLICTLLYHRIKSLPNRKTSLTATWSLSSEWYGHSSCGLRLRTSGTSNFHLTFGGMHNSLSLVKKVSQLKRVSYYGASGRHNLTKKLTCKTLHTAGLTDLHCMYCHHHTFNHWRWRSLQMRTYSLP